MQYPNLGIRIVFFQRHTTEKISTFCPGIENIISKKNDYLLILSNYIILYYFFEFFRACQRHLVDLQLSFGSVIVRLVNSSAFQQRKSLKLTKIRRCQLQMPMTPENLLFNVIIRIFCPRYYIKFQVVPIFIMVSFLFFGKKSFLKRNSCFGHFFVRIMT